MTPSPAISVTKLIAKPQKRWRTVHMQVALNKFSLSGTGPFSAGDYNDAHKALRCVAKNVREKFCLAKQQTLIRHTRHGYNLYVLVYEGERHVAGERLFKEIDAHLVRHGRSIMATSMAAERRARA